MDDWIGLSVGHPDDDHPKSFRITDYKQNRRHQRPENIYANELYMGPSIILFLFYFPCNFILETIVEHQRSLIVKTKI